MTPANALVRYVVRIRPEPSSVSEVGDALARLQSASRSDPGCLRYDVFAVDDGLTFLTIEEWVDETAARGHAESEAVRAYRRTVQQKTVPSEVLRLAVLASAKDTASDDVERDGGSPRRGMR